jgi:zinc transporter
MQIVETETPGLIWACGMLPGSQTPGMLKEEALPAALAASEGFVWLHLNLADVRVADYLATRPDLTEPALIALTARDSHPAVNVDEGSLYGTLIDYQREFDRHTRDLGRLHFAICGRLIVTTRVHPLRSLDRVRVAIEKSPSKFALPIDVFEQLVVEVQRTMFQLVLEFTEELNEIEDAVYGHKPREGQVPLQPLRRSIVRLHRYLRTMLTAMRHAAAWDEEEMPEGFDESAARLISRLEAADHEVSALQDRARLLHEEADSRLSAETNRHLYILSVMTAFLLPPTLVTGFFGMNTPGLPFSHDGSSGTIWAFGLIIASTAAAWWLLRRVGIL